MTPEHDIPARAPDPADAWRAGRPAAYVGIILGLNSWIVVFAVTALAHGEMAILGAPLIIAGAMCLAMTTVALCMIEYAMRSFGYQERLPTVFAIVAFALGCLFVVWDASIEPALMEAPGVRDTMRNVGSAFGVPWWLGPIFLVLAALLFLVIRQRIVRLGDDGA